MTTQKLQIVPVMSETFCNQKRPVTDEIVCLHLQEFSSSALLFKYGNSQSSHRLSCRLAIVRLAAKLLKYKS